MNKTSRDYLELACISTNVSYKGKLAKQELVHVLVTGKVKDKRPQLRAVFDEFPARIFDGMLHQVSAWCPREKLAQNVSAVA